MISGAPKTNPRSRAADCLDVKRCEGDCPDCPDYQGNRRAFSGYLERPNTPKDATGVVKMDKAVRLEPASCPLDPFEFADAHEQPRAYFRRLGGYFGSNVFCEEEVEFNLSVIRIG